MGVPFTFIHAADLHLDSPFRGLSKTPDPVREALSEATFAALRRLTETAIAEKVDFVVIAGDLFDEADRSLRAQLALVREWEKLAEHGVGVYVIHGNHDHLGGRRAAMTLPPNVHIFGSEEVECRPAYRRDGELAAYVYGISYGERAVTRNLALDYVRRADGPYHIAMLHGNVGGDSGHDSYAPCRLEELKQSRFDYWALGHIHKREVLNAAHPCIVYPGNAQGRNPREKGIKGCYVVTVSDGGSTELAFSPLGPVLWEEAELSIAEAKTEQELLSQLMKLADDAGSRSGGRPVMLRLTLNGRGTLHGELAEQTASAALLENLQRELEPVAGEAWVYVYSLEIETGAMLDWESLSEEDSFAGELYRLGLQLESDEEEWRRFASSALGELASHGKLGRPSRELREALPLRLLEDARELAAQLTSGQRNE
ncbi:metallophosphoesterase family protein [Paenibacillus sp. CAU 1782]